MQQVPITTTLLSSVAQPRTSESKETMTAASAKRPEEVISQEKAKRKCHHPARQPIGAMAINSKARTANPSPMSTPYFVQSVSSILACP